MPIKLRSQNGLTEYMARVRSFSRNAWLYIAHVVGMDVIYGTWQVLFNLYLLAVFADGVAFELFGARFSMTALQLIGYRILIAGVFGALGAIPAGIISDRLGRKLSFVLGDGAGAAIGLINITTLNPIVLLITPIFESSFGNLHGVTEPAFMAENSEPAERVHLFSVASGVRTLAALAGSLLAGFSPDLISTDKITAYRIATFVGIAGWFLSLIPALLLRQKSLGRTDRDSHQGKQGLFAAVKNPRRIAQLVTADAFIGLGGAFVLPLFNVYFHESVHAHDSEIGTTFAGGSLFLAVGALLAPFLASRMGKVPATLVARSASIPFVLLLAFSPDVQHLTNLGSHLTIAGFAYIARTTFMNLANPIASAFSMEILSPQERATAVGIGAAVGSILYAIGGWLGAQLMNGGDFRTPFLLMATLGAVSVALYWRFFGRKVEGSEPVLAANE